MEDFIGCFRKVIEIVDHVANSPMTANNVHIKLLADWSRHSCDKLEKLQTKLDELEEANQVKKHIIETFRQHIKNKWNWSDEDVLEIIRKTVINDEDYEVLKGDK